MINIVTDNETGKIVFASSYYSKKQLKLKWNIGYSIENIAKES